jgi:hypothetical protein
VDPRGRGDDAEQLDLDASLRERNPAWGLRRLEDLVTAAGADFAAPEVMERPANNVTLIPNPMSRTLRPPKAGGRPDGRRAMWRAAKRAEARAGDRGRIGHDPRHLV